MNAVNPEISARGAYFKFRGRREGGGGGGGLFKRNA